jgi:hypothetical protein
MYFVLELNLHLEDEVEVKHTLLDKATPVCRIFLAFHTPNYILEGNI